MVNESRTVFECTVYWKYSVQSTVYWKYSVQSTVYWKRFPFGGWDSNYFLNYKMEAEAKAGAMEAA